MSIKANFCALPVNRHNDNKQLTIIHFFIMLSLFVYFYDLYDNKYKIEFISSLYYYN